MSQRVGILPDSESTGQMEFTEVIKRQKCQLENSSLLHVGMTLQNDNCAGAGMKEDNLTGRIQNGHLYLHRDTNTHMQNPTHPNGGDEILKEFLSFL